MRRNRVLILFAVVFAASIAIFWLGSVLADVAVDVNNELTVNVGSSGIIDNSLLRANDPDTTDEIVTYTLVTAPANGMLVLTSTSTTLTPDSQFNQSDIDSNFLVYTHDGTATIADSFNFTVTANATITDGTFLITINQPPEVLDQVFNVNENSTAGTAVDTIFTSDLNTSDTFTYTILDGNLETAFEVGSSNGAITVANAAPLDFETNENITFTVEVEDMGALTDTAVITVNINNINEAPTVDSATFSVPENSSIGTAVDTVTASDPEEDDLTYSIISGDPDDVFDIEPDTGQITVADNTFLDYEAFGDPPHFSLTVEVVEFSTTDLFTDTTTIIINVEDINEPPVLNDFTIPDLLPEDSSSGHVVGTVPAPTDPDADETFTYSITGGNNNPNPTFNIDPDSRLITVADTADLDFETTPTYNLTVEVEDSGGEKDTATIIINLEDVNEPPEVSDATFTPNENLGNGEPVGTVPAFDPEMGTLEFEITAGNIGSAFAINSSSGQITVNDSTQLDFESTPTFILTVTVDDGTNPLETSTITINLNDLNESPTINNATFDVDENSTNGTAVGSVPASDQDAGESFTYGILSGNSGGAFSIDDNGNLTVAASGQLDYETIQSFMLSIIVTDTGGLDNTANVTIDINNLFDETPTVGNAIFTVAEDIDDGAVVGTVSATDPEFTSGDTLSFSIIGGNTGSVFAINNTSGQITVPDASKLDADAMPTFNLTVQVIDKGGNSDTGTITIKVSPLPITNIYLPMLLNNYPPIEPNNNCSQSYGIGSGTDYTFTADDVEDWYAVTLTSSGNLTVILSSFEPAQGQLIVYGGSCGSLTLLGNNGNPNTTDKTLNLGVRPAGTYYIRVFSQPVTNTTYTLRVNVN